MEKNEIKKYKSKVGIVVPILYLLVAAALLIVWLVPSSGALTLQIIATCILAIVFFGVTWIAFSTYYILADRCLICICGPFKTRALYQDITDVTEGFSLLFSYALTGRRIFINRGRNILRRIDVSPSEKEEFLNELSTKIKHYREIVQK